ncbi:MAG TPA: gliding motility-associated C-terminal domain-containing protein [Chitinophagaceae bacterium]|nr:gliding motility-associated C-terminal domain-containing protein [Chitinophagaceae bacterium]
MNAIKITSILFLIVCMISLSKSTYATHASGGELIYEQVPGQTNQYRFIFKFYRSCGDPAIPGNQAATAPTSMPLCAKNSCGLPAPTLPTMQLYVPVGGVLPNGNIQGAPISYGCPNTGNKCTDLYSSLPGYQEYWYTSIVTLTGDCNNWVFWTYLNARNGNINNLVTPGSQNLFVETTFDNSNGKNNNSSPYFSNPPIPFLCVNMPYTYNNGAIDVDNDSLTFESIAPRNQSGCNYNPNAIFLNPWTATEPFNTNNTFNVNPITGETSFTAATQGIYVITIKVNEWRNGVLIGYVLRDIQMYVGPCNSPTPTGLIDTNTIVGGQMINGIIEGCAGDTLKFCYNMTSTNPNAILVASDNHNVATPGADITYTGTYTQNMQGCFSWATSVLDTGLHILTVTIKDSSCPPNGFILSGSLTIPIRINPITQAFGDTIMCNGGAAQLQAYGGSSFIWTVLPGGDNIGSLSCTNCPNPIATPSTTTSYVVTSDLVSICNKSVDTVVVQVAPNPNITITPNSTTCVNADFQLNASAGPPGPNYTYSWAPATYLNDPNIPNPIVHNPQGTITYTVTVIPNNLAACQSTATVTINVLLGFDIGNHDTTICDGDVVQITGGGDPLYTYQWTPATFVSNPNILTPTITPTPFGDYPYTVTASYPGCPDSTKNITITVEPIPVVNAGPDLLMCTGDTLHIHGLVTPLRFNGYSYSWSPISDIDFPTELDIVFDGASNTTLTLSATTPAGCSSTDFMIVTVKSPSFITAFSDKAICPNDSVKIYAIGSSGFYEWWPKDFITKTQNDTIIVKPITSTDFFVMGVDTDGCLDTAKVSIIVNPDAVLDAGDTQIIYPGESAQLYASGNCSFFQWSPPYALSDTKIQNPIATPSVSTRYFVTASTEAGCSVIDSVDVLVSPESIIELPNAFSPGAGTSINDELRIIVKGIVKLNSFKLFNRWGEEVFSTSDIEKGWNGQYKGKPQPIGVYVYVIDAVSQSGKRFYKQGNVTLIR